MRKIIATILLLVFVATQCAKQAAYLECRITNFFNNESGKCDCEKILSKSAAPSNESSLPVIHSHIHIDESYFPAKGIALYNFSFAVKKIVPGYWQNRLLIGFYFNIDRPPQIG